MELEEYTPIISGVQYYQYTDKSRYVLKKICIAIRFCCIGSLGNIRTFPCMSGKCCTQLIKNRFFVRIFIMIHKIDHNLIQISYSIILRCFLRGKLIIFYEL